MDKQTLPNLVSPCFVVDKYKNCIIYMIYVPRTHSTVIVDINIKGITRSVIRKLLTAKFKTNLKK